MVNQCTNFEDSSFTRSKDMKKDPNSEINVIYDG